MCPQRGPGTEFKHRKGPGWIKGLQSSWQPSSRGPCAPFSWWRVPFAQPLLLACFCSSNSSRLLLPPGERGGQRSALTGAEEAGRGRARAFSRDQWSMSHARASLWPCSKARPCFRAQRVSDACRAIIGSFQARSCVPAALWAAATRCVQARMLYPQPLRPFPLPPRQRRP